MAVFLASNFDTILQVIHADGNWRALREDGRDTGARAGRFQLDKSKPEQSRVACTTYHCYVAIAHANCWQGSGRSKKERKGMPGRTRS